MSIARLASCASLLGYLCGSDGRSLALAMQTAGIEENHPRAALDGDRQQVCVTTFDHPVAVRVHEHGDVPDDLGERAPRWRDPRLPCASIEVEMGQAAGARQA